jgi:hypothetical protein
VIAATFLISIGLVAVLLGASAARDTQDRTTYLSEARCIAQSRVEQMRAISFGSITSLAGSSTDSSLPAGNTIVVTVAPYPNSSETDIYKGTVTVTWHEGNGNHSITYETLISNT